MSLNYINYADPPSKVATDINSNFESLTGGDGEVLVKPVFTSSGNLPAIIVAGGNVWTTLPDQPLSQLTIYNDTGYTLEMRQDGAGGVALVFPDRETPFFGISNANQVALKRRDNLTEALAVHARWEA